MNAIYGRVTVRDIGLHLIAKNADKDEIFEALADTSRVLANRYWDSFVNLEQYERLKRGEGKVLAFHSVLKPKILAGFAEVSAAARMLDMSNAAEADVRQALGEASPSILCTRSFALVPWSRAANRRAGEWMLWAHLMSANAPRPSLSSAWLNGWKRKTAKRNRQRLLAAPSRSTPACGAFRLWKGA